MSKGTKIGKCKLCLKIKELNFEHIPPRSAFNKNTSYYNVDQSDFFQKAKKYTFENIYGKDLEFSASLSIARKAAKTTASVIAPVVSLY